MHFFGIADFGRFLHCVIGVKNLLQCIKLNSSHVCLYCFPIRNYSHLYFLSKFWTFCIGVTPKENYHSYIVAYCKKVCPTSFKTNSKVNLRLKNNMLILKQQNYLNVLACVASLSRIHLARNRMYVFYTERRARGAY